MFKGALRKSSMSSLALCDDYYKKGELDKRLFLTGLSLNFNEVIRLNNMMPDAVVNGKEILPSYNLRDVFIQISNYVPKSIQKKLGLSYLSNSMKHRKVSGYDAAFFVSNMFGAYLQIMHQAPTWAEVQSQGIGGMKNKDFILMSMFEDFFIDVFSGNENLIGS